jgi:receptor protein-tyrosine kinase
MDFTEVVLVCRARWWLITATLVAGVLAAVVVSLLMLPHYMAKTQLFVSTTDNASTSDVLTGSQFSQQRVASYARLLTGEELARRVADRLDVAMSPSDLAKEIRATALQDTVLLDVTVTDPSPKRAQAIAQAVGREFSVMVAQLETPEGSDASPVKVTVTDQPELPDRPSSPKMLRNIALGAVLGLLAGVVAALTLARLDRSVKDGEEASELARAPVIGTILKDQGLEKRHTIERTGDSRSAEDYRQLRNNLQFLRVDDPPRVIMVSSALPSQGKTTLVVNLSLTLADAGQRVVIVEADLRRPKVTAYMGLVSGVGLTNVLTGTADLDEVVQNYDEDGVSVVASGPTPPNPGELLASSNMQALLGKLRGRFDYVLVDAPPLLPVADASGLAAHVDGVLLSVRFGDTRKEQLHQAAVTVERVGGTTLGLVLNIVPPKAAAAAAYGYGYTYEPGKHSAR